MNPFAVLSAMGPRWAAYRLWYAMRRSPAYWQRKLPCTEWDHEPGARFADHHFFPGPIARSPTAVAAADAILAGRLRYFSCHEHAGAFPPDWFADPFRGTHSEPDMRHWSLVSEYGNGDIKCVWEQSRFAFTYPLASASRATGDVRYAEAFWSAVEEWRRCNPPQCGPNWRCGQETAIRLLAWLAGYHAFLPSRATTPARCDRLAQMIAVSARRIEANIGYALSQKNNHGISEAAGLFTAGIVLGNAAWTTTGRRLLEQQARELIYDDGSFTQHSTNYHRLMLQIYLWAVQLGRANNIAFAEDVRGRLGTAGRWLAAMVDEETGRGPNLGANDGALLLPLTNCDYLDFRPTVQAVGAVIESRRWLPAGPWDALAAWLGAPLGEEEPRRRETHGHQLFPDGGYALLRGPRARALMRCPTAFRHRPAHGDLLHVDVWADGVNLLRDGGSYSYNCEAPWQEYFPSVAAHNTIAFDDHDQMPRLSRFLYGRWPRLSRRFNSDTPCPSVEAAYTDWRGARHSRRLELTPKGFLVTDRIGGFAHRAILRWRLAPELVWTLRGGACASNVCTLRVTANGREVSQSIVQGWESLYYLQRDEIPVLQTVVRTDTSEIVTEIEVG